MTALGKRKHKSFKQLRRAERPLVVRKRIFSGASPFLASSVKKDSVWPELIRKITVPCMDDVQATIWLNNKAVRNAIHASPECGEWSLCVNVNYTRDTGSMISYHKDLTSGGYRALIYSGDHDMVVPFTGTQAWTRSLKYKIVDKWRHWESNGQVAGFLHEYANNLTFLTVKGAGHTVPQYKPKESLDFFSCWLAGQRI